MRQLIKYADYYEYWRDGQKVLVQTENFLAEEMQPFTPATLNECFAFHCEAFGLNADGTEAQ